MKQVPSEEKKFVRRAVLISTLLMAALFAAAVALYLNRGALLNKHAQNAAERGDYEQAISVLEDSDVQVDPEQMAEYRYRLALSYLEDGRLSDAETLFSQLSDYADSRTMISECRYRAASLLWEKGDYAAAKDAFYALSGYRDALDRYRDCRYRLADPYGQYCEETNVQLDEGDVIVIRARARSSSYYMYVGNLIIEEQ